MERGIPGTTSLFSELVLKGEGSEVMLRLNLLSHICVAKQCAKFILMSVPHWHTFTAGKGDMSPPPDAEPNRRSPQVLKSL